MTRNALLPSMAVTTHSKNTSVFAPGPSSHSFHSSFIQIHKVISPHSPIPSLPPPILDLRMFLIPPPSCVPSHFDSTHIRIPPQHTHTPLPLPRRLHLRIQRRIDAPSAQARDLRRSQLRRIIGGWHERHVISRWKARRGFRSVMVTVTVIATGEVFVATGQCRGSRVAGLAGEPGIAAAAADPAGFRGEGAATGRAVSAARCR